MVKYAGGALIPDLRIDRSEKASLSTQIVCSLRELILSGHLLPGQRLPSSRTLARDQGVSRTTAVNAYEQLTAEGLIHSRVGAGAYVSEALDTGRPPRRSPAAGRAQAASPVPGPRLARLSAEASEQYFPRLAHPEAPTAFTTGMSAFDEFPLALWSRMMAQYWRQPRNQVLGYPDAEGLMDLRRAVVTHLRANRGTICAPEEVFIFNGAQDAFNRIGNLLLNPGDPVWIENPGPIGARNSLITGGAKVVPVPVDEEGLAVEEAQRLAPEFRLALVTPAHQHPLGVTMSLRRRLALLAAAERSGAWIIEDDYVGEFHYGGHPPATLKSIDSGGRVIYVGTFSKSMFAALRLGYVVAPPGLAEAFRRVAGATMQGAASSLQSVMARFIEQGHFSTHIRRMRRVYAERRDRLVAAAEEHFGGLMEVVPTDTGFQTIGRLAPGLREEEVAQAAARRGVVVAPISRFAIAPPSQKGVVLGFSAVPPARIDRGAAELGAVLRDLRAGRL